MTSEAPSCSSIAFVTRSSYSPGRSGSAIPGRYRPLGGRNRPGRSSPGSHRPPADRLDLSPLKPPPQGGYQANHAVRSHVGHNSGVTPVVQSLSRVPLRNVWEREAGDFTPWLYENLEVLSEVVGLDLSPQNREQSVGPFSIDIVAEDADGRRVIIENQLAPSDHLHLGQLVTYATNWDAEAAIWIVAEPRFEHVTAVNWLNETGLISFWLVKVEAVVIGDSAPAALLTVIAEPSEQALDLGASKKQDRAQQEAAKELRNRFWTGVLDATQAISTTWRNISPGTALSVRKTAGTPGLGFLYYATNTHCRVDLYIDHRDEDDRQAANERTLQMLEAQRTAVEDRFGAPLEWDLNPGSLACRISAPPLEGGYLLVDEENGDPQLASAVFVEIAALMKRFEDALAPAIASLPSR